MYEVVIYCGSGCVKGRQNKTQKILTTCQQLFSIRHLINFAKRMHFNITLRQSNFYKFTWAETKPGWKTIKSRDQYRRTKLFEQPSASVQMCHPLAFSLNWSNILEVILKCERFKRDGISRTLRVALLWFRATFQRRMPFITLSVRSEREREVYFICGRNCQTKHKLLEAFTVRPARDKNVIV
jgi:hypothetical protein